MPFHNVATFTCPDQPGIVHAIAGVIVGMNGNITELQQYSSPDTGMFFMRVQVESEALASDLQSNLESVATRFGGSVRVDEVGRRMRTLILASKEGHCLNALLSHQRTGAPSRAPSRGARASPRCETSSRGRA
jgi:formyltetrahydrofolate deformylase